MRSYLVYKSNAIQLRKDGKTYTEIQEIIGVSIPPSTLSTWFKGVTFSTEEVEAIHRGGQRRIRMGHLKTLEIKKVKRERYFQEICDRLAPLTELLNDKKVAKLALMMLYWCEGAKCMSGSVRFGNSDPAMTDRFLTLMRQCYIIDECKFRCTVQCRADQDAKKLEHYWSRITRIPLGQFYRPQIDPRTVGRPSKKLDYKGVCRIDYFSASVYHELLMTGRIF